MGNLGERGIQNARAVQPKNLVVISLFSYHLSGQLRWQLSVAIGRVRTLAGLQVKGFRKGLYSPHPRKVSEYYGRPSVEPSVDQTCCRRLLLKIAQTKIPVDDHSDDSDFDEGDLRYIDQLEEVPQ
jgi:hypothetical protein